MTLKLFRNAALAIAMTLPAAKALAATAPETVPLNCSKGGHQFFRAIVDMPHAEATGQVFTLRVEGLPSGTISHSGLRYIHEMTTEFQLPQGTTYVDGSARVVPGTGSPNVQQGARVEQDGDVVRLTLPAKVDNGASYTAPSIEFRLRADAPPGTTLPLKFIRYELKAKATLVGDVKTICNPVPGQATIGVTHVAGAPSAR